ncbi:MAG: hypothetical protein JSS76_16645 [Bacteroidetes bacterium]|nr:hypothetical protein [Bacteroidota bacterium]
MFEEIANRDAWGVIRGFVYQVDITLLKWLELEEDEVLELERGEDFDIVKNTLENGEIRDLHQVKFREVNITLSTSDVLQAMSNFFEHRRNNRNIRLKFRYVTNSNYSIERPSLFPKEGKGGIETWIELQKEEDLKVDDPRLKRIRNHLLKKCKETLEKEKKRQENSEGQIEPTNNILEAFINYLSQESDSEFKQFVGDFQWAIKFEDEIAIASLVKGKISMLGYASNEEESTLFYDKLFVFVFKLLSQKKDKRLSKADLNNRFVSTPLNDVDEKLLLKIKGIFAFITERLEKLERSNFKSQNEIGALQKTVSEITASDAVFNYGLKNFPNEVPSPILNGTLRKEKVDDIISQFNACTWIGLNGINGTGKTQLAILISKRYANVFWLDLRNYNEEEKAIIVIEEFIKTTITEKHFDRNRSAWYKEVGNKLPLNTIIVFNDIPRISAGSQLADLLVKLVNELGLKGVKLLTTSNFPIPTATRNSMSTGVFLAYVNLDLTDAEIIEVFKNHNAPDTTLGYLNLIVSTSYRNPRIIAAIVNHLKAINWGTDTKEIFEVVFKREFANEILEDVQRSISRYITDSDSRELLYRLSLLRLNFDVNIVKAVSEIEKAIEHFGEKLHSLTNIWIQNYDAQLLQISPLAKDIGKQNLSETTIKEVYNTTGEAIISGKKLSEVTASQALNLFIDAKNYDRAAFVLILALHSAQTLEEIKVLENWGFLFYWSSEDIPPEMSLSNRIVIRNEQIRIAHLLKRPINFYRDQFIKYANEKTDDINRYMIYLSLIGCYDYSDLSMFWGYCKELVKIATSLGDSYKHLYEDKEDGLESILWFPVNRLRSRNDLLQWIDLAKIIDNAFTDSPFKKVLSDSFITTICSNLVEKRDENETDSVLLEKLQLLLDYFYEKKYESLSAIVLREILWIEYRITQQKANVLVKADDLISKFTSVDAKFIIVEGIGRLLYNNKDIIQSRYWLERAVDFNLPYQNNYTELLIYAASAVSDIDKSKALDYCLRALQNAYTKELYTELEFIYVLAELAIAYWVNSDYVKCFETFELAVGKLFECKKEIPEERWMRYMVLIGNCTGYISSEAQGRGFDLNDQSIVRPYIGILFSNNKKLISLYSPKKDALTLGHLAMFADAINDSKKAYDWAIKAFDIVRKYGDEGTLIMIATTCSQYSLINFKVAEALESYLLATAVSVHLQGTPQEKQALYGQQKIIELLADKPSNKWNTAEEITSQYAIIPLFLMLLTSKIKGDDSFNGNYQTYIKVLSDYKLESSNPLLWEIIIELSRRILNEQIPESQLTVRANTFNHQDRRSEQILCILGIIYLSPSLNETVIQLVNILPFMTRSYQNQSVMKYVVIPFIKNLLGSKLTKMQGVNIDKEKLQLRMAAVRDDEKNASQLILQEFVTTLDIEISLDSRKKWLYDFEEIW